MKAFWWQLTPEWDWKNLKWWTVGVDTNLVQKAVFNTKTPKSVQTLILPNAAGSNTQSCHISHCMISDRKVLNAHLHASGTAVTCRMVKRLFTFLCKGWTYRKPFSSPLGPCLCTTKDASHPLWPVLYLKTYSDTKMFLPPGSQQCQGTR